MRTHSSATQNNIPGNVPPITCVTLRHPIPMPLASLSRQSPCHAATPGRVPIIRFILIPGGLRQHNLISQEAINFLAKCVWSTLPDSFTPHKLKPQRGFDFNQVAMPMVHPSTGETISSYKKQMHNPVMNEIWQKAFGKDFRGIAQDVKMGQKGTNAISSSLTLRSRTFPRIKPSHMPAWLSIFGPRKPICTEWEYS
jgi:hypothetical protein